MYAFDHSISLLPSGILFLKGIWSPLMKKKENDCIDVMYKTNYIFILGRSKVRTINCK